MNLFEIFWVMAPCKCCGRIPKFRSTVLPPSSKISHWRCRK